MSLTKPIGAVNPIPDQTSNSGKYLTTNGTSASCGTVTTQPTVSVTSSTSFTASVNTHYVLTGTATTVTLPPSPAAGDMVWITVANSLTTNVVARNGNQIMGLDQDMTIDKSNVTVQLRWTDSTYDWRLV